MTDYLIDTNIRIYYLAGALPFEEKPLLTNSLEFVHYLHHNENCSAGKAIYPEETDQSAATGGKHVFVLKRKFSGDLKVRIFTIQMKEISVKILSVTFTGSYFF